jgi:hypothetical protein
MLVFVNEQVYFRCRQCIWSEDTCADRFPDKQLSDEWSVNLMSYMATSNSDTGNLEDDPEPLSGLTNILEYYSTRELTHESDAIDAVSGILQIVSASMKSNLLQGLPIVAIDYMILFRVHTEDQQESTNILGIARRRMSFSSWSWAGWKAKTSWYSYPDVSPIYPQKFNLWLDHGAWIVWYKSVGTEAPKAILAEENLKAQHRGEEEVCYSRTSQPDLSGRFGKLDTSRTIPAALTSTTSPYSDQELLRFYTVTVTLKVSLEIPAQLPWPTNTENDASDVEPSAALYDSEGSFAGLLIFDIANFVGEDGEYELTILSDSRTSLFHRMDLPDASHLNPFVSHYDTEQDWRLYWVMLLIWNEGVAERRGLGQLLQSSVEKSFPPGPQWSEIVLG